ncbi:MAG TPA: glycosyl hydrolase [Kineosporiaceae bacterium]
MLVALLAICSSLIDRGWAATPGQNGAAGQDCASTKLSKAEWWYNWYVDPGCDAPGYVPMVSGRGRHTLGDVQWQADRAYSNGYRTLLGFNEPNQADQSPMTVETALDLWPALTSRNDVTVGSPAVSGSNSGRDWLTAFMKGVAERNLRVDFIAAHFYGWDPGSCTAAALESYLNGIKSVAGGRQIWVTEFGCLDKSNTDEPTVREFYQGAVQVMRQMGIQRWAWYTPERNEALVADGRLTPLGEVFSMNSPQPSSTRWDLIPWKGHCCSRG